MCAQNQQNIVATASNNGNGKSLEFWIWNTACFIRSTKDATKYKDFILPLIFAKRLRDVFDDEVNRTGAEVGSRQKAFQLVKSDPKLVCFYTFDRVVANPMWNLDWLDYDYNYNISPSRYVHTGEAEIYRSIPEIVEELDAIEEEARETSKVLWEILKQLGVAG